MITTRAIFLILVSHYYNDFLFYDDYTKKDMIFTNYVLCEVFNTGKKRQLKITWLPHSVFKKL